MRPHTHKGDCTRLENLKIAAQLAPILVRVHGANHPELTQVRDLTLQLTQSTSSEATSSLFAQLRDVTKHYTVPSDGCEAYVSTYEALRAADIAQTKN